MDRRNTKGDTDYYSKDYAPTYNFFVCKRKLMAEFSLLTAPTVTDILTFHKGQYAKAHRSLRMAMDLVRHAEPHDHKILRITNDNNITVRFLVGRLTNPRKLPKQAKQSYMPQELRAEVAFVQQQIKKSVDQNENSDRLLALSVMQKDYVESGQSIECACCYGECAFEAMAQCMEGHLVCVECLQSYTEETVFGSGKTTLECMAPGCEATYPNSELRRCLPVTTLNKLEERKMTESLNLANIENLVKCPHCNFAAILPETQQAFYCHRESCQRVTCRKCGANWNDHKGLSCTTVEKDEETALRTEFEEKMTKAKIRTCVDCKSQFTKLDGCNKMTCRCGTTMCYICRTSRITYTHFCQHPRDPGQPCKECNACFLWSNSETDEERAIEEIKREALEKRKERGYDDEKAIGVPSAVKKIRISDLSPIHPDSDDSDYEEAEVVLAYGD